MHTFTNKYISTQSNIEFLKDNMMGPNAMRIAEEMASFLNIERDMRILDLGCGCGLSTLMLVQKYGVTVFAADLWVSPSENYERFQSIGIDDKAIPISVDATKGLPFAHGYFDVLFSVDAYHYFGRAPEMLPSLIPYVKKGGYIAVAIPGWKIDLADGVPNELKQFFSIEDAETFQTADWWRTLWSKADGIEIMDCREMACCKQAWDEWLTSSNPYAVEDRGIMEAEQGKYFSMIQLIAKVV
jgi:cyclopropane fatty-acyl-phospholipid synthase-like methyltransferase